MLGWFHFLEEVLINALLFFYHGLGNNLGLAIILLTVALNLLIWPLSSKMIQMQKKQKILAPKLAEIKRKYSDKTERSKAQMELYKEEGINPAAGCLPIIVQMVLFIALANVFRNFLGSTEVVTKLNDAAWYPSLQVAAGSLDTHFLIFDLAKNDAHKFHGISLPGILVITAALAQFFTSKAMMPAIHAEEKASEATESEKDDMQASIQKQMTYLMPIMFLSFGMVYPSGLTLYFIASSIFTLLRFKVSFAKVTGN